MGPLVWNLLEIAKRLNYRDRPMFNDFRTGMSFTNSRQRKEIRNRSVDQIACLDACSNRPLYNRVQVI